MKKVFIHIRQTLIDNKVFFETLMATIISIVAIYVSYCANTIMSEQERITRVSESPSINLAFEYDEQDELLKTVKITGIGGQIDKIDIRLFPLMLYRFADLEPDQNIYSTTTFPTNKTI